MRLARILAAVGRSCITAGVLILLFVAYQLWGTGIHEARAQDRLEDEFEAALDELADAGQDPSTAESATGPAAETPATPPPPPEGDAAARIKIPRIDIDKIVVEGVSLDDLKRGPGHYPDSPMPGQPGNAAIAGHRTTYGAPFNRVDELDPGDEILVTTRQGSFRYEVSETLIVGAEQVEVLEDFGDNRLTLTACHPKYSAKQRIVVVAKLADNVPPVSAPPPTTQPGQAPPADEVAPTDPGIDGGEAADAADDASFGTGLGAGLSGEGDAAWPAFLLALACSLIWLTAWLVARRIPQSWLAYAVGAPVFFVTLFFFYENVARLLPANF